MTDKETIAKLKEKIVGLNKRLENETQRRQSYYDMWWKLDDEIALLHSLLSKKLYKITYSAQAKDKSTVQANEIVEAYSSLDAIRITRIKLYFSQTFKLISIEKIECE